MTASSFAAVLGLGALAALLGGRAALAGAGAALDDAPASSDPAPYAPASFNVDPINHADNLAAFLAAIRHFESADGPHAYRMLNGGRLVDDLAKHPAEAGWKGSPLPDATCRAAGFSPGCVSTAAGAYQLIRPTWGRVARRLGLADFGVASQDAAAVELIREAGALDAVKLGRFDAAVSKVRHLWASMPGAGYMQREGSLSSWRTAYLDAGGTLA